MKKVLHITNSSVKSNFLISIAKLYNQEKYKLVIATFNHEGDLHKELDKTQVKNKSFNIADERLGLFSFFSFIFFLKKQEIDIVHVHTFWVSLYFGLAARLLGKKVIMTRHHADSHIKENKKIHSIIDSWTARFIVNKSIAVSKFTKNIMINNESVPSKKVEVIYNGLEELVNDELFCEKNFKQNLQIKENEKLLLCISRLHPEKNIETIIKAIYKTEKKDIHLLVVGNGLKNEYHNTLLDLCENLGLTTKVHFLGFRNDIRNLLNISDLLVHASFGESFGFTVAEAMQQETPIIASRLAALEEVASDEVAFFYDPSNVEELKELIKEVLILLSEGKLESRINLGKKRYQNLFTFKKMITNYEKAYERL